VLKIFANSYYEIGATEKSIRVLKRLYNFATVSGDKYARYAILTSLRDIYSSGNDADMIWARDRLASHSKKEENCGNYLWAIGFARVYSADEVWRLASLGLEKSPRPSEKSIYLKTLGRESDKETEVAIYRTNDLYRLEISDDGRDLEDNAQKAKQIGIPEQEIIDIIDDSIKRAMNAGKSSDFHDQSRKQHIGEYCVAAHKVTGEERYLKHAMGAFQSSMIFDQALEVAVQLKDQEAQKLYRSILALQSEQTT